MNPFLLFQRKAKAAVCWVTLSLVQKKEGRKGKVVKNFPFVSRFAHLRSSFFFSRCSIICHHQWKASMKKKWIGQCYLVCSAKRRIADV